MFLTLYLILALVSTPVASPMALAAEPDYAVPLASPAAVSPLPISTAFIVATTSGDVVAISPIGEILWITPLPEAAANNLTLANDHILVPGARGTLYVLNSVDGTRVAAVPLGSDPLLQPAVVDDIVLVGDEGGAVSQLDASTFAVHKRIALGSSLQPASITLGDAVVFVADDLVVTAVDPAMLELHWQTVLPAAATAMVLTTTGQLAVGSDDGSVVALSSDGDLQWQHGDTATGVMDMAASATGVVITLADGTLTSLEEASGNVQWRLAGGSGIWFAAETCLATCPIVTSAGELANLDATTGAITLLTALPDAVEVAPIADTSHLVIPLADGNVLIWEARPPST